MVTGRRVPGRVPKLAFVFGGQGPQWWAMGKNCSRTSLSSDKPLKAADALLRQHADWSCWQN